MNRSEDDLRAALAATEQRAHQPGDLLDRVVVGARRRHRARLAGGLVAAVLAVGLIGAGVPVALARLRPAPTRPATPAGQPCPASADGPAGWSAAVTLGGGSAHWDTIQGGQQVLVAWLHGDSGQLVTIRLYDPGKLPAATATELTAGQRTAVHGHPAYLGWIHDPDNAVPNYQIQTISWQCPGGRWVLVEGRARMTGTPDQGSVQAGPTSGPVSDSQLVAAAAAVRVSDSTGVLLPFRFGYLPAGLALWSNRTIRDAGLGPSQVDLTMNRAGSTTLSGGLTVDARAGTVGSNYGGESDPLAPVGQPSTSVDGHDVWILTNQQPTVYLIQYPDYVLRLSGNPLAYQDGRTDMSQAAMVRILKAITPVTSWKDQRTWYGRPRQVALPGHR
jgi:hypothetical protein